MDYETMGGNSQKQIVLSAAEKNFIDSTIEQVFNAEPDDELQVVEQIIKTSSKIEEVDSKQTENERIFLNSLWYLYKAIKVIKTEGKFDQVGEQFKLATEGFSRVGQIELLNIALGLAVYSQAIVELHNSNVGKALEYMKKNEEYFSNAGKFSSKFEFMIDHMKLETLFLSGYQAQMKSDYENARVLITQAADAAEKVAHKYYTEDEPGHYLMSGISHTYRAFVTYAEVTRKFNQFEYDKLTNERELTRDASEP